MKKKQGVKEHENEEAVIAQQRARDSAYKGRKYESAMVPM
jgi:hypothetical protein